MRRLIPLTIVVVCLAGVSSTASAGSPKDPVLRSRPADVALAKTLVLARTDLPAGFRDTGPDRSSSNSSFDCKGVVQPDLHRLVMTADVAGNDFERTDSVSGFTKLNTEITLFRNPVEAEASIGWIVNLPRAKVEACLASVFRAALPKTAKTRELHTTVDHRTIGDLHLEMWELQWQLQQAGRWVPVDVLIAAFRRGRALEMLLALNAGSGLDSALVTDLSRTISSRLVQASI
jgi:hypothetical protein